VESIIWREGRRARGGRFLRRAVKDAPLGIGRSYRSIRKKRRNRTRRSSRNITRFVSNRATWTDPFWQFADGFGKGGFDGIGVWAVTRPPKALGHPRSTSPTLERSMNPESHLFECAWGGYDEGAVFGGLVEGLATFFVLQSRGGGLVRQPRSAWEGDGGDEEQFGQAIASTSSHSGERGARQIPGRHGSVIRKRACGKLLYRTSADFGHWWSEALALGRRTPVSRPGVDAQSRWGNGPTGKPSTQVGQPRSNPGLLARTGATNGGKTFRTVSWPERYQADAVGAHSCCVTTVFGLRCSGRFNSHFPNGHGLTQGGPASMRCKSLQVRVTVWLGPRRLVETGFRAGRRPLRVGPSWEKVVLCGRPFRGGGGGASGPTCENRPKARGSIGAGGGAMASVGFGWVRAVCEDEVFF